ncbi:MAG: hypothetical protein ACYTFT_17895, partial [Planctomycetota bacterium]
MRSVAALEQGAIVAGGMALGDVVLDDGAGGTATISAASPAFEAGFVFRVESGGRFGWGRTHTAPAAAHVNAVAAGPEDAVFVGGGFTGQLALGDPLAPESQLTAVGRTDGFVARHDAATGDTVWARGLGSLGDNDSDEFDTVLSIASLADGSFVAGGVFFRPAEVGAGQSARTLLTARGEGDALCARFDGAGVLFDVFGVGGSGNDVLRSVAATAAGDLLLGGELGPGFEQVGDADHGLAALTGFGGSDGFLARYRARTFRLLTIRPRGLLAVNRLAESRGAQAPLTSVAPLPDGGFAVGGDFVGMIAAGSISLAGQVNQVNGFQGAFDRTGEAIWLDRAASQNFSETLDVATDLNGGVVVAGSFENTVVFGASVASIMFAIGGTDACFARFREGGQLDLVRHGGGAGDERATAVGITSNGVVIAGTFDDAYRSEALDPSSATAQTLGGIDGFVATYDHAGVNMSLTHLAGADGDEAMHDLAVTPRDEVAVVGSFDS